MKIIANNKKAYHDYFVEDTYEAGIVLTGNEIKSIRQGKCSIKESICRIINNECFIINMNISHYEHGTIWNGDPTRTRKLLLHKKEISKINGQLTQKGYTLIPIEVYLKDGLCKLKIGLCWGKKIYDKRQDKKNKDINKQISQALKKSIKS